MVTEDQEDASGLESESIPVPRVHDPAPAEVPAAEGTRSKPRHRKKALHSAILKQMEFYFGDANLSKDRFLSNLIQTDPWVDLKVFLQFNKIRALTQDTTRISKALKTSTLLEISEDGEKVRRVTPVTPRTDCEACSVYVQGLPPDANHDWLINIFSRYGPIAYVSVPKYKTNKKIKGFAFVEFEAVEGAQECLKAFEDKACTLPPHTSPQELLSITTFSEDDPPSGIDNATLGSKPIPQDVQSSKRKLENPEYDSPSKPKRVKNDKEDKSEDVEENRKGEDLEEMENEEENEADGTKKKKRKRKRRARAEQPDVVDFGLRIMAKKDWKKLRNKYLELQREKMKQLKQHLRKTRWTHPSSYDRKEKMEVEEGNAEESLRTVPSGPKFTFSEGLIVKIELDEPCTNPKGFKLGFRNEPSVKYIDVRESSNVAYVRCSDQEGAKNFVEKHTEDRALSILSGEEEKRYWEKMASDREEKLGRKDRTKQRGRDKLLKKAEKELGKHIKFDEV
ncbi:la-related protein 7 [Diachasma alloeum]|uniref:la-related protein 7 n=1 Tax=Diachasma alloeum TaxID=454923 RepID=UPI0007384BC4|nr:la-related protein 7 [Diachasma alloeum]